MVKKLTLLAAVGVGYVLGSRAGRERYEKIKRQAENLWHTEPVQAGVDNARSAAADVVHKVADAAGDATEKVVERVRSAGDIAAEDDAAAANRLRNAADDINAQAQRLDDRADAEAGFEPTED